MYYINDLLKDVENIMLYPPPFYSRFVIILIIDLVCYPTRTQHIAFLCGLTESFRVVHILSNRNCRMKSNSFTIQKVLIYSRFIFLHVNTLRIIRIISKQMMPE